MATLTEDSEAALEGAASDKKEPKQGRKPGPGVADYLAGEQKDFVGDLKPHLPQDIIGGTLPHIPGTEEEAVWNAASQACGTEKVHFCYTLEDDKISYLACPSASMSSHPDSWCPLAAALPGNSEYWDRETVYLYEQEGMASALRWDPETDRMQVFLGASRTILPRIQSMDANFVTVNPDIADIVPWRNRTLKREKLARATSRVLVLSGLVVLLISLLLLVYSYLSINMIQRDLAQVRNETENASMSLMMKAADVMQSDSFKHMVRIQKLLDQLAEVDGTLVRYQVDKGQVEWEALIPPAFANDFGRAQGLEQDGRVRVTGSR